MGAFTDKEVSFYMALGKNGEEIARHITWHENPEGGGGRIVYDDGNFPPVYLDTEREEWDEAVELLAKNDVGTATIGRLLELVHHKQATTMIQRLVENSDQLKGALADLGFERYSVLQQLVDADPDVSSIRNGTADAATKKKSKKTSARQR